jgi:hypothetical protein
MDLLYEESLIDGRRIRVLIELLEKPICELNKLAILGRKSRSTGLLLLLDGGSCNGARHFQIREAFR